MVRHKGSQYRKPFPATLGEGAERRIRAGEPWLLVWQQQMTIPVAEIARKSGLSPARIAEMMRGEDDPTPDELSAIAAALGTTGAMLEAVR